jgi:peptide-methionine (R)-S-oxide reductase
MAKVSKSDAEWRKQLTPEQYAVLRRAGTERAGSGEYAHTKEAGVYHCAGCGAPLFRSDSKYESGTGWPSFWEPVSPDAVAEKTDASHGMLRSEVLCASCDGHLGHVFPDGPPPSGRRYCMNSLALKLEKSSEGPEK